MDRNVTSVGKVAAVFVAVVTLASCSSSKAAPKTNVLPSSLTPTTTVAVVTSATTAPPVTTAAPTTTVAIVAIAVPAGYTKEPDTGPLSQGNAGPRVAALQKRLAALGNDPGPVDGAFGQKTDNAVRAFQKVSSLKADGIVGPQTTAALDAACVKTKC